MNTLLLVRLYPTFIFYFYDFFPLAGPRVLESSDNTDESDNDSLNESDDHEAVEGIEIGHEPEGGQQALPPLVELENQGVYFSIIFSLQYSSQLAYLFHSSFVKVIA